MLTVVGGWETEKHKTTRGWTDGCWHAAPTSGDETKILAGHDFESFCRLLLTTKTVLSQGFKTIFLLKVLPHSDKVRFDFFHLEKTYIQDKIDRMKTHTHLHVRRGVR